MGDAGKAIGLFEQDSVILGDQHHPRHQAARVEAVGEAAKRPHHFVRSRLGERRSGVVEAAEGEVGHHRLGRAAVEVEGDALPRCAHPVAPLGLDPAGSASDNAVDVDAAGVGEHLGEFRAPDFGRIILQRRRG